MEDMRQERKNQGWLLGFFYLNGIDIYWAEEELEGVNFGEILEHIFGQVKFEMPISHPNEDIE